MLKKFGSQAIQTASDLEEVQNVVNVSFGSMANEVEAFAKTAIWSFGMSELTAKQTASTFMAMANGMGLAMKDGKNMSLQLTALAGDMASFYNVRQDVAQTALNSVFTGETESLKKFGIVMTEANLSAFALSRGITKSYSAMSQAEKVALRYHYVLKATANAQGDFVRTSGSWANQVRVLKEQFNQLLGILGKGLIQVLTPIVQVLNKLLSYLIAIGNAIAKLFGGGKITSISNTLGNASGSAGDLNDNIGDASGSLEDANNNAKKLQKTIASFDELNVLNSKDTSSSSGSGGTGGTGGGISGGLEIPDYTTQVEEGSIKLGKLGETLVNLAQSFGRLAKSLWDTLIPAFEAFYKNGLEKATKAIGDLINEMLKFLGGELDKWSNWLTENKDQIAIFATNLGKIVEPLGLIVAEILRVAWEALATALTLIGDAVRAIGDAIINMDLKDISTILSILLAITSIKAGVEVSKIFRQMNNDISGNLLDKLFYLDSFFNGDEGKILGFANKFKSAFAKIGEAIAPITSGAMTAFSATLNQIGASGGALTKLKATLAGIGGGVKGLFTILKANPVGAIITAIGLVITALIHLWNTNEGFRNWITEFYNGCIKPVFEQISKTISELWNEHLKPLWEKLKPGITSIWDTVKTVWDTIANLIGGIIEFLSPFISSLLARIGSVVDYISTYIGMVADVLSGIIDFIAGIFTGDWERAWEGVKEIFSSIWEGIKSLAKSAINILIDTVNGIIRGLNKIHLPNWEILGSLAGKGINIPLIPRLEKGGVLTSPTIAMMGEYAGAYHNPEIVTPQNILRETIDASNGNLVSAFYQMCQQVIQAIDGVDMSVSIGDDVIAQSAKRGNDAYRKRTGYALI